MSTKKYIIILLYDFLQFNYLIKPILGFLQKELSIKIIALNHVPINIKNYKNLEFISFQTISKEDFSNMFLVHKPEAIIFDNWKSLFHFTFIRISQRLNIKTIYLYYGHFNKNLKYFTLNQYSESIKRYNSLLRKYYHFQILSFKSFSFKNLIIETYAMLKFFMRSPQYINFDNGIFYTKFISNHLSKFISCDKYFYSGYPMFNTINGSQVSIADTSKSILYIHQPFMKDGYVNINRNDEKRYYMKLCDVVVSLGYRLSFLLHPRASIAEYEYLKLIDNVELHQNIDSTALIANSSIIIGHYSTLLYKALFFNKKIILLFFPTFKYEKTFDEIISSSNYVKSFALLKELLSNTNKINKIDKNNDFMKKYIGNNNSYENLGNLVSTLLSS